MQLGERNAILFNQTQAKARGRDNPDSIYELTKSDARRILGDLREEQSKLDNAPLQTSAQRNLEEEKRNRCLSNKYRKTIIRIQFQNQLILQGTFTPTETVQAIKEFVRAYLENPEPDFKLCK